MDFKTKKIASVFPPKGKPLVSELQAFFDDNIPSKAAVKLVAKAKKQSRA